jgi:CheY-like chemotaxis protein
MGDQHKNRAQRLYDGTILLVEDNADDIELTLRALKQSGLTNKIVTMSDGAQALDYLHREGSYADRTDAQPTLILLDVKLPRVDGLEVLHHIKTDPELRLLPVVMLTSSRQERDVMQAYRLGVNSYVCKPTDFSEFQQVVNTLGRYWFHTVELPAPG